MWDRRANLSACAEARKRIRENPAKYVNHIYGEKELGGSSVLMLSSQQFSEFGLPAQSGTQALPQLTGRVLEHVPDVVSVGCALLGGIYWITNRREIVAAAEQRREETQKEEQP